MLEIRNLHVRFHNRDREPEGFEQHGTAAGRAINSPVGC